MTRTLVRRLEKLEGRSAVDEEPFRWVISLPWKRLDLTKSTCQRYRCENGALIEVVQLDGDVKDLREGELERFIQGFPIQKQGEVDYR